MKNHPMSRSESLANYIERSNVRGALIILSDFALVSAIIALAVYVNRLPATILAVWLIGLKQFSIGEALVHESAHGNLFSNRKLNDLMGDLCALPFFYTMGQYRAEHMAHHAASGAAEDPVMQNYNFYGLYNQRRNTFFLWFIKPLFGYALYLYLRFILQPNSRRTAVKIMVYWAPIIAGCLYFEWTKYLLVLWLAPMFLVFAPLLYWSEIEDHFCTQSGTRSNIGTLSNLLVNHNSGFHCLHHQCPAIPWYNLPRANARFFTEGDVSRGFFDTFLQIAHNRRDGIHHEPEHAQR